MQFRKAVIIFDEVVETTVPVQSARILEERGYAEICVFGLEAMLRLLRRQNVILHTHHLKSALTVSCINFWLRQNHIHTLHGIYTNYGFMRRLVLYFIFLSCNLIICNSKQTQDSLPHNFRRRSTVIYNGVKSVRPKMLNGSYSQPKKYASIGRFVPEKNFPFLVSFFSSYKLPLDIFGDGKQREKLENLADLDFVSFKGIIDREKLMKELFNYNIIVYASYSEGYCNAFVEGMMLNKKLVAYNNPTLKEVAADYPNVYWFSNLTFDSIIGAINTAERSRTIHYDFEKSKHTLNDSVQKLQSLYEKIAW